jgi:NADH-quinone oxidoreductase subunit L
MNCSNESTSESFAPFYFPFFVMSFMPFFSTEMSIETLQLLVPLVPFIGAVATIILGRVLGSKAHIPAIASIAIAAAAALVLLAVEVERVREGTTVESAARPDESIVTLWQWAGVESDPVDHNANQVATRPFSIDVTLRLDPLTATMLSLVTCVGLLVAIYSIGYMHDDPGYPRFFALVAMFVFSMTMLVAASNFLIVYVFWEAVGACSYLLIGFWFQKPDAARAAKKAFLVNRIGDFGFAVALFLLFVTYGTLDFHDSLSPNGTILPGILGKTRLMDESGIIGGAIGTAVCLLLLLAACGKSAQLPLHVWLPDAMEGPTPASALIHAATMVTAGVYLITRTAPLFVACPGALVVVSIVGASTAMVAALIATVQNDLKRVLAYSTISQLGYMFASLGTGLALGFTAAIFHLMTHAFFKALLFLGAGSVMHSMGGVIDMRRFGGLRKVMPITAITFLCGSLALAGVAPFAGFFSKDEILTALRTKGWPDAAHHSSHESHAMTGLLAPRMHLTSSVESVTNVDAFPASLEALNTPFVWQILWWMSLITAGLTAFYTFRAFFMTFTGPTRVPHEAGHHAHESPPTMTGPLVLLAIASGVSGIWIFGTQSLSLFLASTPSLAAPSVAGTAVPHVFHLDLAVQGTLASLLGISIAAIAHLGRRSDGPHIERFLGPVGTLFENKFYIDLIYVFVVVRPLEFIARLLAFFDSSVLDGLVDAVGRVPFSLGRVLRSLQSGLLQRYAVAGVVGVLALVLALVWQLRG